MLPIVNVNLWARLLDGTLLVVREGVASVNALKKVQALDDPKLIGVVVNEAKEIDSKLCRSVLRRLRPQRQIGQKQMISSRRICSWI